MAVCGACVVSTRGVYCVDGTGVEGEERSGGRGWGEEGGRGRGVSVAVSATGGNPGAVGQGKSLRWDNVRCLVDGLGRRDGGDTSHLNLKE